MKLSGSHIRLPATLTRLRPIEIVVLCFTLYAMILADSRGRPFYLLLTQHLPIAVKLLNWLLPCFLARVFFALMKAPPQWPRRFYRLYFGVLIAALLGTRIEKALVQSEVLGLATPLVNSMAIGNLVFFAVIILVAMRRRRFDAAHVRAVVRTELAEDLFVLRLLLSLLLCFATYANLKAMIPILHGRLFDSFFFELDRALAFGANPYVLLHQFNSPEFLNLMTRAYSFFFFFVVFGLTGALLFGSTPLFERSLAAHIVAFFVGAVLYIILPSVGPAFTKETGPLFAFVSDDVLKKYLVSRYTMIRANPITTPISPFNGLAAFPSLHVTHALLFLYYLWLRDHWVVLMLLVPFVLLCVSTVYLGWHYVVDLVAAVPLAVLIVYIVRRMYPEPDHEGS